MTGWLFKHVLDVRMSVTNNCENLWVCNEQLLSLIEILISKNASGVSVISWVFLRARRRKRINRSDKTIKFYH